MQTSWFLYTKFPGSEQDSGAGSAQDLGHQMLLHPSRLLSSLISMRIDFLAFITQSINSPLLSDTSLSSAG